MKNMKNFFVLLFICLNFATLFSAAEPFDESAVESEIAKPMPVINVPHSRQIPRIFKTPEDLLSSSDGSYISPAIPVPIANFSKSIYVCKAPELLSPNSLFSGSAWSDASAGPGVSVGDDRLPAPEYDIRRRISKIQDLKDFEAIKLELIEIIEKCVELETDGKHLYVSSLVNQKISMPFFNFDQCTILHLAILVLNDSKSVAKLIKLGSNVNAKLNVAAESADGCIVKSNTALDLAKSINSPDVIKVLVENGALYSPVPTPIKLFLSISSHVTGPDSRDSFAREYSQTDVRDASSIGDSIAISESSLPYELVQGEAPQFICIPNQISEESCDSNQIEKIKYLLLSIRNMDDEESIKCCLREIMTLIRASDLCLRQELNKIINSPISAYGVGYAMCSLIHLLIIFLPEDVGFVIDFGADVNAEVRLVPQDLMSEKFAHLFYCKNALDLAIKLNRMDVVKLLLMNSANKGNFEISIALYNPENGKPKNKCKCAIV